jgi:protease-4
MSEDTQKPNDQTIESMVRKIFRYQQRQKYWQIAKFTFLILLVTGVSFGILKQINQSFLSITKTTKSRSELGDKKHISLIDLRGPIWGSFETSSASTADIIIPALNRAFKNPKTIAIVLRINSPGGTAVQSSQIYTEIRALRQKHPKVPIYAVCEEVCASAAYHIASACEFIYADSNSLIGSLGSFLDGIGFGYEEALKKLGIERRLMTAGDKKGMLDPYSPLRSEDVQMLKEMQAESHRAFIKDVKEE